MRIVSALLLAALAGCGFTDATLGLFDENAFCEADRGTDCGVTNGCAFDECDLICSHGGTCEDPDIAYASCEAANRFDPGFRSDDGDLLLYDPTLLGSDGDCHEFVIQAEDDAEALDFGSIQPGIGLDLIAVDGGPTFENFIGVPVDDGRGEIGFSLCGAAESFAILINDRLDGRRSNSVCLLQDGEPVTVGGD